jgi:nucleotide-binding universal stress UspA family protein
VIPARRPGKGQGSIVVGVDDSPTSDPALAFAFETADIWRASLIAVHSWNDVRVAAVPVHDVIIDKNAVDRDEHVELAARLRVWQERFPDVAVRRTVARGRPAPSLLHVAHGARLIVVGSRGRGPFTGLLLGSTGHALIAHASCPVVIVRHAAGSGATPPAGTDR